MKPAAEPWWARYVFRLALASVLVWLFVRDAAQLIALLNGIALLGLTTALLWGLWRYPTELRDLLRRPFEWHLGPLGKIVAPELSEDEYERHRRNIADRPIRLDGAADADAATISTSHSPGPE